MKLSHILVLFLPLFIYAQDFETKFYAPSSEVIANPERGFYRHTEVRSTNYSNLDVDALLSYRENESITQILRVFYLENFVGVPISDNYLTNMQVDFDAVRAAKMKVIVRFAYTKRSSAPYGDANPEVVRNHIFQLKKIFDQNKDVISVVQAGFIGAWGEWYYTDHFANGNPWVVTEDNYTDRKNLVSDLLEVVPAGRMVQLRTPLQKMKIFATEESITFDDVLASSDLGRVGHHNDCFVASVNDFGTYIDVEVEKPYLERETRYLPMGGETCALAPPYSDCENAYLELSRFHWSYLNIGYNTDVLSKWREQGCFGDIELNLGYRYYLKGAKMKKEVGPKGTFALDLSMHNQGFANGYNQRNLEVVLRSKSSPDIVYVLKTDEDLRQWPIQSDFAISIEAGFPENLKDGDYEVFLNLPDKSESLRTEPLYAIQLANEAIWDKETGWNRLDLTVHIDQNINDDQYNGGSYFKDDVAIENAVEGPRDLYVGEGNNSDLLFWAKSEIYNYRTILASADGTNFQPLATVPALLGHYTNTNRTHYNHYQFKLFNGDGDVVISDIKSTDTSLDTTAFVRIDVDGLDRDWRQINPTVSAVGSGDKSYILRTYFDRSHVNFAFYGAADSYEIFLDVDDDLSTGILDKDDMNIGMDFKIANGKVSRYDDNVWNELDQTLVIAEDELLEISFPFSVFDNLGNNVLIPITAKVDEVILSEENNLPAKHIRMLPPDLPTNFEVRNSVAFPDERLELHWERCNYCSGYTIEKSDDGVRFDVVKVLDSDKEFYYHDFLPDGVHYYVISSYNALGESDRSDVQEGVLGSVNSSTVERYELFNVWPNPTFGLVKISREFQEVSVYDNQLKYIAHEKSLGKSFDVSAYPPGSYLLVGHKDGKSYYARLVKE